MSHTSTSLQPHASPSPVATLTRRRGITKPAIRRLARRGGVKRISGLIYEGDYTSTLLSLPSSSTVTSLATISARYRRCGADPTRRDPRSPQDLPRKRHPRLCHLHRARSTKDCHLARCRLRPQATGTNPLRFRCLIARHPRHGASILLARGGHGKCMFEDSSFFASFIFIWPRMFWPTRCSQCVLYRAHRTKRGGVQV